MNCKLNGFACGLLFVFLLARCYSSITADEVHHRFGSATLLSPTFVTSFDATDNRISIRDGLRVRNEARQGELPKLDLKTVFAIRGDGHAKLDFDCKTLGTPDYGSGSGLYFEFDFVGEKERKITIALVAESDGSQQIKINEQVGHSSGRQWIQFPIGISPIAKEPSSFRFSREGSVARIEAEVDGSMVLLSEKQCPESDIFPIRIRLTSDHARADLDMTLKELSVSGASLPADALVPPEPTSRWKWLLWFSLACLFVMMCFWARNRFRTA